MYSIDFNKSKTVVVALHADTKSTKAVNLKLAAYDLQSKKWLYQSMALVNCEFSFLKYAIGKEFMAICTGQNSIVLYRVSDGGKYTELDLGRGFGTVEKIFFDQLETYFCVTSTINGKKVFKFFDTKNFILINTIEIEKDGYLKLDNITGSTLDGKFLINNSKSSKDPFLVEIKDLANILSDMYNAQWSVWFRNKLNWFNKQTQGQLLAQKLKFYEKNKNIKNVPRKTWSKEAKIGIAAIAAGSVYYLYKKFITPAKKTKVHSHEAQN